MRTQVGIIGAGPAGLFLAHLLHRSGIECVVLERQTRAYVEARVRAGVLEPGTVATLKALGLGERMHRDGMVDSGLDIRFDGGTIHLDLPALTGHSVMIYGQQEVVKDLVAARLASGEPLLFGAQVDTVEGLDTTRPVIRYRRDGAEHELGCDFVAACDGYHGVGRTAMPPGLVTVHERQYGFAWLGVLSRSPPLPDMTYSNSDRGFALCSRRSPEISRLYLQVGPDEDPADWSDDRFWAELHHRMFDGGTEVKEGVIFQKDMAQLRAFVAEPMQHGRLFLAGDAVHIVPPTGAKGLNLAVGDARTLARGLVEFYREGRMELLSRYSHDCLGRVWQAIRFSAGLTGMLHRFPEHSPFERAMQQAELQNLHRSATARAELALGYVSLGNGDLQ